MYIIKDFLRAGDRMEDSRIIELYWSRDEGAIAATSEKYGAYCRSVAMNILRSAEDAEECVSDTWLGAWNSIPPKRPSVLRTFLGRITRNLSFNKYKRDRAEKRGGGEISAVLDELAECVSGSESPEQELARSELAAEINGFLGALPLKKRSIFVSRYWYAESVSDIAKRCGMSETNVSVTLNRLRAQLREHLTERGYEI